MLRIVPHTVPRVGRSYEHLRVAGIVNNVPGGLDPRHPTANQSLNSDSIESGLMTVRYFSL